MDEARRRLWRMEGAYHEAGHAIIAGLHGLVGDGVSLKPAECDGTEEAGETKLKAIGDLEELQRDLPSYIITAAAGREAQELAIGGGHVPIPPSEREAALCNAAAAAIDDRKRVQE